MNVYLPVSSSVYLEIRLLMRESMLLEPPVSPVSRVSPVSPDNPDPVNVPLMGADPDDVIVYEVVVVLPPVEPDPLDPLDPIEPIDPIKPDPLDPLFPLPLPRPDPLSDSQAPSVQSKPSLN